MTIVCGDSHTSTHGAFGALAFGIGTSEVEHVLATQTLPQVRPKTMAITVDGELQPGVTAKDVILAIIGKIGTGGGIGHIIEYRGSTIRSLSMEGRMTVCNMSIEAGAKAGMVAPDDTTFAYIEGRAHAPKGALWERALDDWRRCRPTTARTFDREVFLDGDDPAACLLGHQPGSGRADRRRRAGSGSDRRSRAPVKSQRGRCATWDSNPARRCARSRSTPCSSAPAPTAGSRICVSRPPSSPAQGAPNVRAMVVPGSMRVRAQAEPKGSIGSSRTPGSSGVPRVARCAWA